MTPAVTTLKQASVPYQLHEYAHVAGTTDFGLEAVRGLGQDPDRREEATAQPSHEDPSEGEVRPTTGPAVELQPTDCQCRRVMKERERRQC